MASIGVQMIAGVFHDLIQAGWIWAILIPLELVLPKGPQLSASVRLKCLSLAVLSWCAAGAGSVLTGVIARAAGFHSLMSLHFTPATAWGKAAYLVAGTLLAVLTFDFLYYWFHRAQHTRLLWRQHVVHHSIRDLSATNYSHWTEELIRLPFIVVPMVLVLPDDMPANAVGFALVALQSQHIHAQTRFHLGPFWRIVYDNRFHRIHHSTEPHHFDKNFGVVTPLWDWMFGTLYVPKEDEWPDTGLADHADVDGVWDYLWRPFRLTRKRQTA